MKVGKSKNKGITLIALVITIIVLLILAGVSIATLTGENGILTRAVDAKEKTEESEDIENIKLAINESNIPQEEQGEKSEEAILKEIIEKNTGKDVGISKKGEDGSYVVTIGDKEYLVDGSNVTSKKAGITDKQVVLVASTDNIIFTNTINEEDIKAEYPDYQNFQILGISESEAGEYKTSGEIEGKAGNIEIIGDLQQSTYQYKLKKPMLGDEQFFVKVAIDGEERIQKLEVIQGDIVRYEEDMLQFTDSPLATETNKKWIDVEGKNFSGGKAKKCEVGPEVVHDEVMADFEFMGVSADVILMVPAYESVTVAYAFNYDSRVYRWTMIFDKSPTEIDKDYYGKWNPITQNSNYEFESGHVCSINLDVEYASGLDVYKRGKGVFILDAVDIYRY